MNSSFFSSGLFGQRVGSKCIGPERGYYLDQKKSILNNHPDHLEAGNIFGASHEFKVCTGAHYLFFLMMLPNNNR